MRRSFLLLFLLTAAVRGFAQDSLKLDNEKLLDFYQNQRYGEAAQYLQNVYKADTENPKELSQLAYASLMAGKLPLAESYYLKLYAKDSVSLPVLFSLADISVSRGKPAKAKEYYLQALKTDSNNFSTYKRLAELSKADFDINRLAYLLKANELNPADAGVAFGLAELHLKMNYAEKAAQVLKPALEADSANLQLLKMKIPVDIVLKKYADAIETGEKVLGFGDSSTFTLNNLGKAYYLKLDYKNALKNFLKVKDNGNEAEALYFNIARSYRGVKDYGNAVLYMQKAIKEGVSPLVASYYGLLGDSFENLNKNEDANKAYKKGLDFENDGSLLYNIALVYENKLNDKKNAISYYEQYLKTIDKDKQPKLINFIKGKIDDLKR